MNNVKAGKPLRRKAKYPEKALKLTDCSSPEPAFSALPGLTRPLGLPKYRLRSWHSSHTSAATHK
jgi:hypothetical protein